MASLRLRITLATLAFIAAPLAHGYARFCASHDALQFGNRSVGTTTTVRVSVANCGDESWRFTDVRMHAATGSAYRVSSACATGVTLAPGEHCAIDVTFAPLVAGQTSGALWLRQTTTTPDQLLTFYGRGVTSVSGSAAIEFAPAAADFGNVVVGTSATPITVALRNVGPLPLTPSALVINGPTPYDFGTISYGDPRDCAVGRPVASGSSCLVNFTFTPVAEGRRHAQLVVDAPELASLVAVPLIGAGTRADAGSIEAIEFHHAARRHYFLTTVAEEADNIDAGVVGPGWVRTGQRFRVWPLEGVAPAGVVPVCRFFGTPHLGPEAHFFTGDSGECASLRGNPFWIDEGLAFRALVPQQGACPPAYDPVIRLYATGHDATEVRHRYVVDAALIGPMLLDGWIVEGPVFCSPADR